MSEYKEVLWKWAAQQLDDGAIVKDVRIEHSDGYRYSSLTFENPYTDVVIYYELNGYRTYSTSSAESMEDFNLGVLLQQLFAIAEAEDE